MASVTEADQVSEAAKEFAVLARELQENLTKAETKNEALLEAIESSESKSAADHSSDAPVLRNLRARLAAAHAPNAALRRELGRFMGLFERRFKDLDRLTKEYSKLLLDLKVEKRHFEEDKEDVQKRKLAFEKEREEWREKLEDARTEIQEQNDRLAVLADQLSGAKVALDSQTRELASRRLAFEEEKLAKDDREFTALDTEAEELRQRLREQIVRNSKLEDRLLQADLSLHQKGEAISSLTSTKERLQRDLMQSRQSCSKAVRQFEKRTNEANQRLADMNSELAKSQEHARRFQELLAVERRKQKGLRHALEQEVKRNAEAVNDTISPQAQKAYLDTLADSLSLPNKPRNLVRVDDVVRKNEQLTVENANLKADIRRLRMENTDLIRQTGHARANDAYMRNQVAINIADRFELQKRLERAELQYRELQASLTRQAADWIAEKKHQSKGQREQKWRKIEPLDVFAAESRLGVSLPKATSKQLTQ